MCMFRALAIDEKHLYRTNNLWKSYVLNLLSLKELTTQYGYSQSLQSCYKEYGK